MRALGWNCQGKGMTLGSTKMQHLARLINSAKPQVTFVSEIKSSKVTPVDIIARFNMSNSSGGLWLMWSDDLQLTVHTSHY
jgi:hypothetical protein